MKCAVAECHCRWVMALVACFMLRVLPAAVAGETNANWPLPQAKPEDVGLKSDVLAKIRPRMEQFVADGEIAGAVTLLARKGKIVHWEAVGWADLDAKIPMQKDSLFQIASMTKPITATGLMILVDRGKVNLDDPVTKYLPEFAEIKVNGKPLEKPLLVRHLLTHTSGLTGSQRTETTLAETVTKLARWFNLPAW